MGIFSILYVEDDDNDVFLFQYALQKAGVLCSVHQATDGLWAREYLTEVGKFVDRVLYPLPKLVVIDLKMPHLSGFELLSWIRQQPSFAKLPVVVLSSSNYSTDIRTAFALGANGYLVKPSNSEELVERLKDLVRACSSFHFEADGWLTFSGNEPLRGPGRDKIPFSVHGPFPAP